MTASAPRDDISVVLCAYTEARWNDLVAAVQSVRLQTLPPREIIIVIDHNPALLERVRAEIPGVLVIENQQARGESGGRNTGTAAALGSIVVFLDEDAVAEPDWLEQLTAHYRNPQVLGVGGSIEPVWVTGRPSWFPEEFNWIVGCTYKGMPLTTARVRNLIGANMSFRRWVFMELGGMRAEIGRVGTKPLADAETEFSIRVGQHWPQHMLLYEPRARVHHRVPAVRAQWNYFCSRSYSEGMGKARVALLVGARDGLASERTYTFRTLPLGVVRGLTDTLFHLDLAGVRRAGAIVTGLAITTAAYVRFRVAHRFGAGEGAASNEVKATPTGPAQ